MQDFSRIPEIIKKTIPFLLLSLPIYFFAKYLEKKINPRKCIVNFFGWILTVLATSLAYFYTIMFLTKQFKWNFMGL
jgi:hypothetical protein